MHRRVKSDASNDVIAFNSLLSGWRAPVAAVNRCGAVGVTPRIGSLARVRAHSGMHSVDGGVMDRPEWNYEIAPPHDIIRPLFDDLPPQLEPLALKLGYDFAAMVAAKDRLKHTLHNLDARRVRLVGNPAARGRRPASGRSPQGVVRRRRSAQSAPFLVSARPTQGGSLAERRDRRRS